MTPRSFMQDHPTLYVWFWKFMDLILPKMKGLFEKIGVERSSAIVRFPEEVGKHLMFNCQDCGQCVLHYTGMTCPMNCPKYLRNGPCGGVRLNGKCEVKPEMDCVWTKGYERAQKTPWAKEFYRLNAPVDIQLEGMASWVTFAVGKDQITTGSDTEMRYATEAVEEA